MIFDFTNLSKNSRLDIIKNLKDYTVYAAVFFPDLETYMDNQKRRESEGTNKVIPEDRIFAQLSIEINMDSILRTTGTPYVRRRVQGDFLSQPDREGSSWQYKGVSGMVWEEIFSSFSFSFFSSSCRSADSIPTVSQQWSLYYDLM